MMVVVWYVEQSAGTINGLRPTKVILSFPHGSHKDCIGNLTDYVILIQVYRLTALLVFTIFGH